VDDRTFSSTGESFSTVRHTRPGALATLLIFPACTQIILPKAESTTVKKLQSDDVSLAYGAAVRAHARRRALTGAFVLA
jgi:hypothetical protein